MNSDNPDQPAEVDRDALLRVAMSGFGSGVLSILTTQNVPREVGHAIASKFVDDISTDPIARNVLADAAYAMFVNDPALAPETLSVPLKSSWSGVNE
jgi:hypothetical protein